LTITETLGRFLSQLEADGRSRHTRDQYRRHVNLLARWARDVRACGEDLAGLGHEAVAQFLSVPLGLQRQDGQPKKPGSMNALTRQTQRVAPRARPSQ
jgi:hypothetical protein